MQIVPFTLPEASSVLVVGAGGGFDFVCGLPIALELEARGHEVHIANYSFTNLRTVTNAKAHSECLLEVTADSGSDDEYFPEKYLAMWFRIHRKSFRSVWCLGKYAVPQTLESYRYLVNRLKIHTVVCVDGGVDGIFRGDETDLGTPSMDAVSVISASLCGAESRIYASVGFGTEGAEGQVCHAQALQRMAELVAADASFGVGTILRNTATGRDFLGAVDFIFGQMSPVRRSIMVSSLVASINGAFGHTVVHPKTEERPPWLSPLTSLVWYFEADAVAKNKLFYEEALRAKSLSELSDAIEAKRREFGVQPPSSIPI